MERSDAWFIAAVTAIMGFLAGEPELNLFNPQFRKWDRLSRPKSLCFSSHQSHQKPSLYNRHWLRPRPDKLLTIDYYWWAGPIGHGTEAVFDRIKIGAIGGQHVRL